MKICRKCGEEKPLSEYSRNNQQSDGHAIYCKQCEQADAGIRRANKRKIDIHDIKCRKCGETYPSPFMKGIREEYDCLSGYEEQGTCIFCTLKEKYQAAINHQNEHYGEVKGYICPNPECKSIHFYNSGIPILKYTDKGYCYSEPEKTTRIVTERALLFLGKHTEEKKVSKPFYRCKKCGRAYLEDRWAIIPADQILESHYLKLMGKNNPDYVRYCQEMEVARKNLLEIKDFNCSQNGVCGVLQAHHMAHINDPERLTTDFLLGLINPQAREAYTLAKAGRDE